MKFLDIGESAQVLGTLVATGVATDGDDTPDLRVDFFEFLGQSAALSRLVASIIDADQKVFLWIREFGIWPSLENWDLCNTLRQAAGETRPLTKAPGHEFSGDELLRLISYLQLMLLHGWGGVLVGYTNRRRVAVSHDSWLSISHSNELPFQTTLITNFGLPFRIDKPPKSLLAT